MPSPAVIEPVVAPAVPTIADRLEGAAAYIEEHGGHVGTAFAPEGGAAACVYGAVIASVLGRGDCFCPLEDSLPWMSWVFKALGVTGHGAVYRWNDAPGRTDAERAALLRRAATLARADEAAHA